MGLDQTYGFAPVGDCRIEWRPMRCSRTQYAGQPVILTSLGSVATAPTAATGLYGILAADIVTTATEKTTKVPVYVFNAGAKFCGKTDASAGERMVGTLADIEIHTSSYYRVGVNSTAQNTIKVLELDSRDSGTAAGRRVIFTVLASSSYEMLGR